MGALEESDMTHDLRDLREDDPGLVLLLSSR
jgi:hypothetical protein